MKAGAAAQRYARAVFSLGIESGEFERIGQEIHAVSSAVDADETLKDVLSNPLYDAGVRREIITGLAEKNGFTSTARNFLLLLVDKDRISLITEISKCYQGLADEKAGKMKATVVTASKVSEGLVTELTASLEKGTGKKVSLSYEVDPALIGGIVLKVGDIIYDGSIRTQLHKLRDNIRKTV